MFSQLPRFTPPSLCKVFLAPPARPSCVQVSPLYRSLRSIVLKFLCNLSCLSTVRTGSKFLWPSSGVSCPPASSVMTPTQLLQAGSHSPYTRHLLYGLVGAVASVKNALFSTKTLYSSAQMLFPPHPLLSPLQETVLQRLNIYVLLRLLSSNTLLLSKFLFKFFPDKIFC